MTHNLRAGIAHNHPEIYIKPISMQVSPVKMIANSKKQEYN
jgi:hypothetical protein